MELSVSNATGAALDDSSVSIADRLPAGLVVTSIALGGVDGTFGSAQEVGADLCGSSATPAEGVVVSCSIPATLDGRTLGREAMQLRIGVQIPPDMPEGEIENFAQVEGGGGVPGTATTAHTISSQDAPPAVVALDAGFLAADGSSPTQAGSVPFAYRLQFARSAVSGTSSLEPAGGLLRGMRMELPPGVVSGVDAGAVCAVYELEAGIEGECPDAAAVGTVEVDPMSLLPMSFPLYAMTPAGGAAATFGFRSSQFSSTFVLAEIHRRDGGASAWISGNAAEFRAVRIAIWGDPSDPGHDRVRGSCLSLGGDSRGSCPVGPSSTLLRLPTSCERPVESGVAFDTWEAPGFYRSASASSPLPTGCGSLLFDPAISVAPSTTSADSPAGLSAHFSFHAVDPEGPPATADLRRLVLDLPAGLVINPAGAEGRVGCRAAEIHMNGLSADSCPDGSRLGTAQIRTSLADQPITGAVYLASPGANPFGALFAVYLVFDDAEIGVRLKLAGRLSPDPETGQLRLLVEDLPQIPLQEISMDFFGGERGLLRTPLACGAYLATAELQPWSAPASGPDANRSGSFAIDRSPGGVSCPASPAQAPHDPVLRAGTTNPVAGDDAPFVLRIVRKDGSQGLGAVDISLPRGLGARLAGIPLCRPAGGKCSAESRVGTVSAWAGAGLRPVALTGSAYLSGPYDRAPVSLVIEVPALTGPFYLGTVRSRFALQVDRETGRLRVRGTLPTILSGVPLDLRALQIELDRQGFVVNPTSCNQAATEGRVLSPEGGEAEISAPFQVGGCSRLGFKPRISLGFSGAPPRRGGHPRMRVVLRGRPGDANISRASILLPSTELLDNANIRGVCPRPRFAAGTCPARSLYGEATIWTPLLDEPLQGPVYLRASDGRLPDLVAALDGQLRIDLAADIDAANGRLRTTFEELPDIPFSRLELSLNGGRRGLLVNNIRLCSARPQVAGSFGGHNGKAHRIRASVRVDGCGTTGRDGR
ncbi:MAG TPA: hypothetical protein VI039_12430 [Solirubrobacterales bacterium]